MPSADSAPAEAVFSDGPPTQTSIGASGMGWVSSAVTNRVTPADASTCLTTRSADGSVPEPVTSPTVLTTGKPSLRSVSCCGVGQTAGALTGGPSEAAACSPAAASPVRHSAAPATTEQIRRMDAPLSTTPPDAGNGIRCGRTRELRERS
jgi:hypothetical protein